MVGRLGLCAFLSCVATVHGQIVLVESIGICPTDPAFRTTAYVTETRTIVGTSPSVSSSSPGATLPNSSSVSNPSSSLSPIAPSSPGSTLPSGGGVSTPSSPAPSPASTSIPRQFLITFQAAPRKFKRALEPQAQGFITDSGKGVQDCRSSTVYSVSDAGILSTGEGIIFSTDSGVASQPFVASSTIRSIYAVWQLNGNILNWNNGLFLNGKASFALTASNTIQAYFTIPPPVNATEILFKLEPLPACPGHPALNSASSSPSSPSTSPPPPVSSLPSSSPTISPSGNFSSSPAPTPRPSFSVPGGNSTGPFATTPGPKNNSASSIPPPTTTTLIEGKGQARTTKTVTGVNGQKTVQIIWPDNYGLSYNVYLQHWSRERNFETFPEEFESNIISYKTDEILVTCGNVKYNANIANDFPDGDFSVFGYLPDQDILTDLYGIVLVFQGYFVAPATGEYIFRAGDYNLAYIWVGENAISNWTLDNALALNDNPSTADGNIALVKESITPFTLLYAVDGELADSNYSVILPDGTEQPFSGDIFLKPLAEDDWAPTQEEECPDPPAKPITHDEECGFDLKLFYASEDGDFGNIISETPSENPVAIADSTVEHKGYAAEVQHCEALSNCVGEAKAAGYETIGFYEILGGNGYKCAWFKGENDDPEQFNKVHSTDNTVGFSWGYTLYPSAT